MFVNLQLMLSFIQAHRTDDVRTLALQLHGRKDLDAAFVLKQIEGWQRLRSKVPSWAATEELHYPSRLALEQCSSEATALYKQQILGEGRLLVDLTGGLGVDFSFCARGYERAVYVERNPELCALARHNMPLLGLPEAEIVEGDGVEYLRRMPLLTDSKQQVTVVLDPYRRDEAGRKTVRIEDCTPNVLELLPLLQQRASRILIKLSPMLDITTALRSLAVPTEVHIVGTRGEVKEILLLLGTGIEPRMVCHEDGVHEEVASEGFGPCATGPVGSFLYEPAPTLMKAGCYAHVARRYGLHQLHHDSHLYSGEWTQGFPGRSFRVERISGFGKRELREFVQSAPERKANITVRNFPMSVAELRKRLKVAEGGSEYWFATTLADGSHALIACSRLGN